MSLHGLTRSLLLNSTLLGGPAAAALLAGETDGLALNLNNYDALDSDERNMPWNSRSVQIRTAGVDAWSSPSRFFTNTAANPPNPKWVRVSENRMGFAPHNMLQQSETLDNAYWAATNSAVTANQIAGPDGVGTTADLQIPSAGAGVHAHTMGGTALAYPLAWQLGTFSLYAKSNGTYNFIALAMESNGATGRVYVFNLTTGAVTQTTDIGTPSANSAPHAVDCGNGWWRFGVTSNTNNTQDVDCTWGVCDTGTPTISTDAPSFTADGTSGCYVFGAQFNAGAEMLEYVVTTTSGRLGVAVWYGLGLITENASTVLASRTSEPGNAGWTKTNATTVIGQVGPDGIAQDGTVSTAKLVEASDTGQRHSIGKVSTNNFTSAQIGTWGAIVKAAGRNWVKLELATTRFADNCWAYFNLTDGSVGTVGAGLVLAQATHVVDCGDGWWWIAISATCDSTGTNLCELVLADADNSETYNGDGSSGVLIHYLCPENSNIAAVPHTPSMTGGTATNTTIDAVIANTSQYPHSDSAGTFISWVYPRWLTPTNGSRIVNVGAGNTTERIFQNVTLSGKFTYGVVDGNVFQNDTAASETGTASLLGNKVANAYQLNNIGIVVDGSAENTDTGATMPTSTQLNMGYAPDTANRLLNGWIAQMTYVPRRMTEAEMQARTS
jgi:hypothetical protein